MKGKVLLEGLVCISDIAMRSILSWLGLDCLFISSIEAGVFDITIVFFNNLYLFILFKRTGQQRFMSTMKLILIEY